MRTLSRLVIAIALLAAGCSADLTQLKSMKDLAAAGRYDQVAAQPVGCTAAAQGCTQMRAIKADACRRLAATDPPAARRPHLDCAIENYGLALAGNDDPEANRAQAELGLLDSLQRRRDVASDKGDADRQNADLAARAAQAQQGRNARPAGFYYAADAELNTVLRAGPQGGCAEIGRAASLLTEAHAEGTSLAAAAGGLGRAVANARRARSCPA